METPRQYKIAYTETAIQDLEERQTILSASFGTPHWPWLGMLGFGM